MTVPATLMMIRSKMNELAWRQHFPFISQWEIFRHSRVPNSVVSGPIWPKFERFRDFMHVLVTCKYKTDRIKKTRKDGDIVFPIMSMGGKGGGGGGGSGGFCCHGNQSFDPTCHKTLCSLSPTPVMLHIKFDQDCQMALEIFKFKSGRRRTDDGPLVYYKLTLWAFGSG